MSEIINEECPFCKQKIIRVMYRPEVYTTQTTRAGSNRKIIPKLSQEKYEVLVDKCPNCGKSKKEIEKALAKGKEPSNEEIVKRLREAGLDPTKLR